VKHGSKFRYQPPVFDDLLAFKSLIAMQEGIIAGITDKGFGFIRRDGAEKDLFFHSKELVDVMFDDLRQGDKVSFEMADGPKGPYATNVRRI